MFYNVPLSNIVIKHDRDIRWQSCLPIAHIRRRDVDLDLWRHPDDVDKLLGGQEPYDFHTWIPGVFFATGEFALSQWPFRRTLSHCLIAAMFLSIALIFVSYFSCFFLSSWIFRLYIWPQVDFQIFGEKALWKSRGTFCFQGQGTQRGRWHWASIEWTCKIYYISCILYAWMASRSCVSFCSSIHDAFDSVFRWLFLQYREIETSSIEGHELDIFPTDYIVDGTLYW